VSEDKLAAIVSIGLIMLMTICMVVVLIEDGCVCR
jgi:hypothetical protein